MIKPNKKSQVFETNIQSLQQKIQDIETSFQILGGEFKEANKGQGNRSFNRFVADRSPSHKGKYRML